MPEKKTKRSTMVIAVLAMLFALALVAGIFMRNQSLKTEVDTLQSDLAESQNRWQQTAAEKETLQEELTQVENDIREAQLSLDESTAKAEELRTQIADLTALNTSLTGMLEQNQATVTLAAAQTEKLTEADRLLDSAITVLRDQMEKRQGQYTGGLWVALEGARHALVGGLQTRTAVLNDQMTHFQAQLDALPATGYEEKADSIRDQMDVIRQRLAEVEELLKYYTE